MKTVARRFVTGPTDAAMVLGAVLATFILGLFSAGGSLARVPPQPKVSDPEVYDRILDRLAGGESYYVVVGDELRSNGYATREIFNWRTPVLWRTLATVHPRVRRILLTTLAGLFAVAAVAVTGRVSRAAWVVTATTAIGVAVLMSAPGAVAMGEAWAGCLIGLSICAYARGKSWTGFGLGLVAMFVRELVAPFAVLAALIAAARRRWLEAGAWLVGGVVYAAYYTFHLLHILAERSPTDPPGASSWVAFGGLTFLLSAVQWNALLFFAPWPVVCACLALIVAGVLNPRCPTHARWTAAAYALLFLVIGKHFDRYWGYLTWPAWSLACGFGADRIVGVCRALRSRNARPSIP
jgi:hypothetical protein